MIFVGLFLALVAFIETGVFFYLKLQVKKLGQIKIVTHLRNSEAEALVEEADKKHQEAEKLYDEATHLLVRARQVEDSPLLH